uniref:SWIM-type domain-containing protein n=1 Tax=Plectus sambesii TaxID=2011161 RepID=A0A914W9A6_9BILA
MRKKEWSLVATFEESDSMLAVVREKTGTVRQKRTVETKTGVSVYYLCKHERKFNCPYQMRQFKPEMRVVGVVLIGKMEDTIIYECAFEAIATALKLAGLPAFVPDAVMSDGDPCITAAVASCFPNARRLTCYYHMKKQVQRKMGPKRVPKDCRKPILEELRSLQLACSDNVFKSAAWRLLKRWKDLGLTLFIRYFKRVWVKGSLRYWYEGAALGLVSTNNGLESLHGRIKRFGTLRKRMPVGLFVKEVHRLMKEWSQASESQPFLSVPPRTLSLEVKAFHWSEDPTYMEFVAPQLGTGTYFMPGSCAGQMSYRRYGRCDSKPWRFKTFGQFVVWSKAYYRVFRNADGVLLCTCASSAKMYICKHSVAIECMKYEIYCFSGGQSCAH